MLYFVSTPIGNLGDISLRGIEVLKSVDIIACEDTRHSLPLLKRYEINKPLISYHKFNEQQSAPHLIELLKAGKQIAVISDAGTPLISDPGNVLVSTLIKEGLEFTVVPGANAVLPALILSGLYTKTFTFIGFLPEKSTERRELLEDFASVPSALVIYSAPQDLEGDLKSLYEVLGKRQAVIVKEITKIHETRYTLTLGDNIDQIDKRGEFIIVVEGFDKSKAFEGISLMDHVLLYEKDGLKRMDAIKKVAKERGVKKSDLYKMFIDQ